MKHFIEICSMIENIEVQKTKRRSMLFLRVTYKNYILFKLRVIMMQTMKVMLKFKCAQIRKYANLIHM